MQSSNRERPARKTARRAAACVLTGAVLSLFGCGAQAGSREFRIGLIVPKSGPFAAYGGSHVEGARLAVAEANRDGGLLLKGRRYKVVLVEKDGGNSPEKALGAAQELINREAISALVGPILSGQAIPVAHLVDRAGIPMIVQIATNPAVTRGTRSVFRVCYTDDFQGVAMARFARERLGGRTAALLYDVASAYNSGVAAIFAREFAARGGRIVASETYTTGAEDFRAQLSRIAASRPDLLFLPNYPNEILPQVMQMRELGIQIPLVGSDAMSFSDPLYMAAIDGAWYGVHFSADHPTPVAAKFLAVYQDAYKREPDQGGALSYDAVGLLLAVARARQSVDPQEIAEGLRTFDVFDGVTGSIVFRGASDPGKGVVVVRMLSGKARFQTRIDP